MVFNVSPTLKQSFRLERLLCFRINIISSLKKIGLVNIFSAKIQHGYKTSEKPKILYDIVTDMPA